MNSRCISPGDVAESSFVIVAQTSPSCFNNEISGTVERVAEANSLALYKV